MSGHSKWTQIKRQKGVADIKRGQMFTKIANAITISVRQGGGIADPDQNFRLRLMIEKAKSLNVPRENIERAIARAKSIQSGENIEEAVYEGFGPGKVAILIEAATDNKMRTTSEMKSVFDKNGVTLVTPGSVSYLFKTKGLITILKKEKSMDDIFLQAVDYGAQDIKEAGDEVFVYTKMEDLGKIKEALSKDFPDIQAELIRQPIVAAPVFDGETAQKIISLIEKFEAMDDVLKVYTNFSQQTDE